MLLLVHRGCIMWFLCSNNWKCFFSVVLMNQELILLDKTPRDQLKSTKKNTWTIKEFKSSSTVCTLPELFECGPILSDHIWHIDTWQHIAHICITHHCYSNITFQKCIDSLILIVQPCLRKDAIMQIAIAGVLLWWEKSTIYASMSFSRASWAETGLTVLISYFIRYKILLLAADYSYSH
jgi:hypothetical protein